MVVSPKNIDTIVPGQEGKTQNIPSEGTQLRYRQTSRLADISVGRIRRWSAPFRRPFLL